MALSYERNAYLKQPADSATVLAPFFSWQPSPQRTLKVKMSYENRAKINLSIGIAVDTNATEPLRVVKMYHFQNNGFFGPMLGTWADDSSHKEPMEFGYDLTDLTQGFDSRKSLKYFFFIKRTDYEEEGELSFLSVKDYSWQTRVREYPIVEANEKLSNQGLYTWSMVIPGSPLAKTPYVYESNYALIKVPLTDAEYPIANLKDMNPATSWRASPKESSPITLIIGSSDSSVGLSYTGFPLSKGRIQNYRILGTHSEGIDTIASGSFENTNKEQFLFWPKAELYTEIKLEILNTTGGMPAIAELTLLKYSPDTVENAHDDGRFAEIAELNYPLLTNDLVPLFLKQRLSKPKGVSSYSLFRSDDQLKVKIKNRNYRLNGQVDLH